VFRLLTRAHELLALATIVDQCMINSVKHVSTSSVLLLGLLAYFPMPGLNVWQLTLLCTCIYASPLADYIAGILPPMVITK
jgi:hypothetical protein